jgi:hypothetical protein
VLIEDDCLKMKLDKVCFVFKIVLVKFKFHWNNDLNEAQCDFVCQQETALRLGHKAQSHVAL